MRNHLTKFVLGITFLTLLGCATTTDIQRATDLIRTDNELTQLLVEVRPNDLEGSATYLVGIATHAKTEAESLKGIQGKEADAVAYYRIAATAYWKSGNLDVANDLFETSENGSKLCAALGEAAPDRDCMFLQLVIPFAGLESLASELNSEEERLSEISFYDSQATEAEIKIMQKTFVKLNNARKLTTMIYDAGKDNQLLTHQSMKDYYCTNVKKADDYYSGNSGLFLAKVKDYYQGKPGPASAPPLDLTIDQARGLKIDEGNLPEVCM